MERSAVSLGPTALAARDRLLAALPGPGERLGAERELAERLGVSRSTIRAALADLERSGVVRRTRGRSGGIFVAERKVERDLTSLDRAARLPAAPGLPGRRARALHRDGRGGRRDGRRAGDVRGRTCPGGRARAARRRRPDLARARAVPGRSLPRPARPLARRLALRAARDALRRSSRGRRRSGSRSSPPARRRRGCWSCAAAPRCWPSRAPRGTPTAAPSSARTTCSAPTAPGSWSARAPLRPLRPWWERAFMFTTGLDRVVRSWFNCH